MAAISPDIIRNPFIGTNGNWYVWDSSAYNFVDTGVVAGAGSQIGNLEELTTTEKETLVGAVNELDSDKANQTLTDAGGYYTVKTPEGALQEVGAQLADIARYVVINNVGDLVAGAKTGTTIDEIASAEDNKFLSCSAPIDVGDQDIYCAFEVSELYLLRIITVYNSSNTRLGHIAWANVINNTIIGDMSVILATYPTADRITITFAFSTNSSSTGGIVTLPASYDILFGYKNTNSDLYNEIDVRRTIAIVNGDGYGDYETIQSALAGEAEGTPIRLMPGEYAGTVDASTKKIVLLGVNRDDCIVSSYDGRYNCPAAKIADGYIENITFKMEYLSGTSYYDPSVTPTEAGGYSVHTDYDYSEGKKLTFKNCDFHSDYYPAVGIGLRPNFTLEFIGCRFYTTTDEMYTSFGVVDLGAVYWHDSATTSVGDNQIIIFRNCEFYGVGDHALAVNSKVYDAANYMYVQFINCTAYSDNLGMVDGVIYDLTASVGASWSGNNCTLLPSAGNNIPRMNT